MSREVEHVLCHAAVAVPLLMLSDRCLDYVNVCCITHAYMLALPPLLLCHRANALHFLANNLCAPLLQLQQLLLAAASATARAGSR